MKTAYLILVHRYPQQFKRLFRAIYTPANHYLIHVDKTIGPRTTGGDTRFLVRCFQCAPTGESKRGLGWI